MIYYDDTATVFWVDQRLVRMTEEQAEKMQTDDPELEIVTARHDDVDLDAVEDIEDVSTDADDTIDCQCTDTKVCNDCYDFFQSLIED